MHDREGAGSTAREPAASIGATPVGADEIRALWRNTFTVVGGSIAGLSALATLSLLFVELISGGRNPYLGVFTFLVFPTLLMIGVALVIVGLFFARRRMLRVAPNNTHYQYYPRIDLTRPGHRRFVTAAAGFLAIGLPVLGVVSYEGYHFTESNTFCGKVCHEVMEPQYTAFQHSPHAHVSCAECHIGSGASWYVKSKLSGLRQVFATTFNTFSRPIPPAIKELRPATETCQECHWPSKFYGDQLVTIDNYASDEANTHSQLRMVIRTGGSDPSTGPPSGIHWHMSLGFQVEYVATDERLQEIPWVRLTDRATGRVSVYRSDGLKSSDPVPDGTHRTVDCMDCHNRPTHIFRAPDSAADTLLNVNPHLQSLPFAKRETVAALIQPYQTHEEGMLGISDHLAKYYQKNHPDVWATRKPDVDQLTLGAQQAYARSFFPRMDVSWRTYPNNIGHKNFPGCFRCHEGKHVSDDGRVISRECQSCHQFLQEIKGTDGATGVAIGEFVHPMPLEGAHAKLRCDQCHTGGVAPRPSCETCHASITEYRDGTLESLKRFAISADSMAGMVKCEDCHDLSKPTDVPSIDERCMGCHDDDEERYSGMLGRWKSEVDGLMGAAEARANGEMKEVLQSLRAVGPLHNVEATRKVLKAITSAGETAGTPSNAAP